MQLFIYLAVMVAAIIGGVWYVRRLDSYELYDDAAMLRAKGHRVVAWILSHIAITVERFVARRQRACCICNDPATTRRDIPISDDAPGGRRHIVGGVWHLCSACADEMDFADYLEGLA